jgi:cysteine-rich repeat protein
VCGNGSVETGEECDDGNMDNADACLTTCRRPVTWAPGDPHFHSTGCGVYGTPEDLAGLMRNQGLQVGAALVWRDGFDDDAPYFTGRDHPLSAPGFILHYDMEVSGFPADQTGHLLLLGLDGLDFSSDIRSRPLTGVPVVEWARRQPRAVVGMAHGQFWRSDGRFPRLPVVCCMPWEFAVHAARGKLDFIGFERLPADGGPVDEATFLIWKALQNSGLRVALTGASDYPCITHVGNVGSRTPRTDVIVDGALTYERWLEGIKAGRTAAAIGVGNRLNLRVNGTRLGGEVRLAEAGEVALEIETAAAVSIPVEVLINGAVAATIPVEPGVQVTKARVPVSRSSWISARSPYVLTSPVFVLVGGQPIRASADDTCYLLRYIDYLTDLVTSRRLDLGANQAEALTAYDEARAELQKRFTEAGGTTCR